MAGDWTYDELLPIAAVELAILGSAAALYVNCRSHCLFPLPVAPRGRCEAGYSSPPTATRHPIPEQEFALSYVADGHERTLRPL